MTPRCGRIMHPYEAVWGALLDDVTCGRPEGHSGQCRSVQSLRRERERSRLTWPERQAERQRLRRQRDKEIRRQLAEAVEAAAQQARERALAARTGSW